MSVVTLDDVTLLRHADYRGWGYHMCKFAGSVVPSFPPSDAYGAHVFVKMDVSQVLYAQVAQAFFPNATVLPPTRLLSDRNRSRLARLQRTAPSDGVPAHLARAWRATPLDAVYASITPLYHKSRMVGRRLYDGAGDCTGFATRRHSDDLVQVVLLDYLFGCRDRVANCFLLDGAHLVLDTCAREWRPDPPPRLNYGAPDDYLETWVREGRARALRPLLAKWLPGLHALSRGARWLTVDVPIGARVERDVRRRAQLLVTSLTRDSRSPRGAP